MEEPPRHWLRYWSWTPHGQTRGRQGACRYGRHHDRGPEENRREEQMQVQRRHRLPSDGGRSIVAIDRMTSSA